VATRRLRQEHRQPGLPSLNQARHDRKRALVLGRARVYGGSPQFWMWTLLGLSVFVILYWKFAQGELASLKGAVMAKQRAVAQTLGPRIVPFCEQIEKWILELRNADGEDFVAPEANMAEIANGPGVYLRLRRQVAGDVPSIRTAASRSLRDGFTSCLFVREESATGAPCKNSSECESGQLCNDWTVCARPSQPFNMRLAYRALKVLEPEWTDALHQASTDLAVRAFELDLESVVKKDVPIAAEVLARARFVTVVLDDEAASNLTGPTPTGSGGSTGLAETEEERLHRVPHKARVGIWDIAAGRLLVRVAALAAGGFVPVGGQAPVAPEIKAAQERQVNSCALALHVREAVAAPRNAQAAAPGTEDGANVAKVPEAGSTN
jgi:hypothetical protein